MTRDHMNFYLMRNSIVTIAWILCAGFLTGQGTLLSVKGSYGMSFQKWNNFERDFILSPGVDVMAETYDPESINSFFAEFGFHTRGSSVIGYNLNRYQSLKFHNLVLGLGAKQGRTISDRIKGYYLFGIRGEMNVATNFEDDSVYNAYFFVDEAFVERFLFGVSVGGGLEYNIGENRDILIELIVSPDLTNQYFQPYEFTRTDPNGFTYSIRRQEVKNISVELKLGYRFLY